MTDHNHDIERRAQIYAFTLSNRCRMSFGEYHPDDELSVDFSDAVDMARRAFAAGALSQLWLDEEQMRLITEQYSRMLTRNKKKTQTT